MIPSTYLFSTSPHPDAINVNSLDIELLKPEIDFFKYDYLIITSKQISKALKQYKDESYINKKALCVSEPTALSFQKISGKILEWSNGYGNSLVDLIKKYPKNTKWLYLRGATVASNFVGLAIKDGYDVEQVILYESRCSQMIKNISVESNATLIFTSPSSVECFLKNKEIYPTNRVIVIGKTTAKALPEGIKYIISDETSIESCFKLI